MPMVQLNIPCKPFPLLPLTSYPYEPPTYFPSLLVSQDANRIILSKNCKIRSLMVGHELKLNTSIDSSFFLSQNVIIFKKHNWAHPLWSLFFSLNNSMTMSHVIKIFRNINFNDCMSLYKHIL